MCPTERSNCEPNGDAESCPAASSFHGENPDGVAQLNETAGLVSPSRAYKGYARPSCSCIHCISTCKGMPGHLMPYDYRSLIPHDADPIEWAEEHLLASLGTLMVLGSQIIRMGTLVPKRSIALQNPPATDGPCHWLDFDDKCRVHADAPFGCAFFTNHGSKPSPEQERISLLGSIELFDKIIDTTDGDVEFLSKPPQLSRSVTTRYILAWNHLFRRGHVAVHPLRSRLLARAWTSFSEAVEGKGETDMSLQEAKAVLSLEAGTPKTRQAQEGVYTMYSKVRPIRNEILTMYNLRTTGVHQHGTDEWCENKRKELSC